MLKIVSDKSYGSRLFKFSDQQKKDLLSKDFNLTPLVPLTIQLIVSFHKCKLEKLKKKNILKLSTDIRNLQHPLLSQPHLANQYHLQRKMV